MTDDGHYVETEYGQVWKSGKPKKRAGENPHSRLKHKCRAAVTEWRLRVGAAIVLLPSFVGTVTTETGRTVYLGKKGQADDCWLLLSTAVLAEYKSGQGEQNADQKRHQQRVEATGCIYVVVRHPADLIAALDRLALNQGYILNRDIVF